MNQAWLHQTWVHAHEEDEGDLRVFRPSSHRFPPSRGRQQLDLRKDGTMTRRAPGATDRAQEQPGLWQLTADVLTLIPPTGKPDRHRIVALEADRLVLGSSQFLSEDMV